MTLPTLMTIFYAFFGRRRSRPHCARTTPHHEANNTQASAKTRFGTFLHKGEQWSQTHGRGASLSLSLSLSLCLHPFLLRRAAPIQYTAEHNHIALSEIPSPNTRRDKTKNSHKHTHKHTHTNTVVVVLLCSLNRDDGNGKDNGSMSPKATATTNTIRDSETVTAGAVSDSASLFVQ